MEVRLAYGKQGLKVNLPEQNVVRKVNMNPVEPIKNPEQALADSLVNPIASEPLAKIAQGRESAVIVISDITRPVPNQLILPPILKTIEDAGVPRDKITILIATGIHRPNLGDELISLVGEDIAANYRVVNHYSEDPSENQHIGFVMGDIPVEINKHFLNADLKILTGLVELHLMAGFSGGRKSVLPGIATLETMKHMHGYRMIQLDETCNGKLDGNPFHEAAVEVARQVNVDFIVNVTLDEERHITGIYSGDLEAAHEQACKDVSQAVLVEIAEPVDIVVTSGGGYPLDKTLYQTIKGVVAAMEVLKPGGTIIIAAENDEGAGSKEFVDLLRRMQNPMDFYEITMGPNYVAKDQWMIQEMVNALHHVELLYYTEGISNQDLRDFLVQPIDSVEDGISQALNRHGNDAKMLLIPEGPYVLPLIPGQPRKFYSWQKQLA